MIGERGKEDASGEIWDLESYSYLRFNRPFPIGYDPNLLFIF